METALAVANYFVTKAINEGAILTPMKLVKLVYVSHGWYLALYDEPLISEAVQAWKFGPVIPTVYHGFKDYGDQQITSCATEFMNYNLVVPIVKKDDTKKFLNAVWEEYKKFNGLQLSALTHQSDTPWDIVYNQQGGSKRNGAIITNDLIKEHYKGKIAA